LQSLRLSDVRVRDGRLSFHGPDAAPPMIVDSIDADLSLDSLDDPANAKGTLSYLGQILSFDASFAAPRALIAQGETPLALQFKGALVEGELDGSFDARTGAVAGKAQARGTSTRRVLEWLGSPLPPGDGFAAFSARGDYRQDGEGIRLGGARFSMDAIEATGDLLIKTIKGRMAVSGALNAPRLDVNPYMPAPAQAAPGAAGGVNTAQPWSTAPIDLSGLRGADADLTLTIGALAFQKMTFENARLGVRLNDGALDARLSHFAMYGGTGSGRLLANARGPALQLATEMRVNGVQALPFLRDAIGFERIEGAGQLTASFAGEGRAQADIMRSLRGTTSFTFTDGAFKGVNLANVARTVQAALSGQAVGSSAKTDFAELAASFQVADGVAVTQDLRLLNPFVRLDGRGLIDIGAQTLDMRLAPRVVGSIEGQGGEAGLQGIGVPFRAYGPWSAPRFAPDLQDTLRNAVQEQARKALGRSNLGDLGALLGLGAPAQTPTPAATGEDATAPDAPQEAAAEGPAPQSLEDRARERARDALGGLFKRDN
jgi:AsmA protein